MDSIDLSTLNARDSFQNAQAAERLRRLRSTRAATGTPGGAATGGTPGGTPGGAATGGAARSVGPAARSAGGRGASIDRSSKLYQVSQEFEAVFIKQMLKVMRETVPEGGLMDGGMAEEIFEDMLYDEYALKMARTAGFGLADQVYLQLTEER